MAQGSGFFISADGYIVTNNHVVDHATEVTITTSDGKTMPAKVIGTDPKTDIALLKVKGEGTYPFVDFASQSPRVGDWVIAVGNPFGLGGTVTAGIVSARGRDIGSGPYDDFLQIDAPVNHGNSGGPTFNTDGEVVGVNTAIFSPSGGSVGIGFAIASDVVKNVVAAAQGQWRRRARLARRGNPAGDAGPRRQPRRQERVRRAGRQETANSPARRRRQGRRRHHRGQRREVSDPQGSRAPHRGARAEEDRRARDLAQWRAEDHRRHARRDAGDKQANAETPADGRAMRRSSPSSA